MLRRLAAGGMRALAARMLPIRSRRAWLWATRSCALFSPCARAWGGTVRPCMRFSPCAWASDSGDPVMHMLLGTCKGRMSGCSTVVAPRWLLHCACFSRQVQWTCAGEALLCACYQSGARDTGAGGSIARVFLVLRKRDRLAVLQRRAQTDFKTFYGIFSYLFARLLSAEGVRRSVQVDASCAGREERANPSPLTGKTPKLPCASRVKRASSFLLTAGLRLTQVLVE